MTNLKSRVEGAIRGGVSTWNPSGISVSGSSPKLPRCVSFAPPLTKHTRNTSEWSPSLIPEAAKTKPLPYLMTYENHRWVNWPRRRHPTADNSRVSSQRRSHIKLEITNITVKSCQSQPTEYVRLPRDTFPHRVCQIKLQSDWFDWDILVRRML